MINVHKDKWGSPASPLLPTLKEVKSCSSWERGSERSEFYVWNGNWRIHLSHLFTCGRLKKHGGEGITLCKYIQLASMKKVTTMRYDKFLFRLYNLIIIIHVALLINVIENLANQYWNFKKEKIIQALPLRKSVGKIYKSPMLLLPYSYSQFTFLTCQLSQHIFS